jgi:hypothetical protein
MDDEAIATELRLDVMTKTKYKMTKKGCWNLLSWASRSNGKVERVQAKFNVGWQKLC